MRALLVVVAIMTGCGDWSHEGEECQLRTAFTTGSGEVAPHCAAPLDTDGDGIPDATDECPDMPETVNGYHDGDGCPDSGADAFGGTWVGMSGYIVADNPAVNYQHAMRISHVGGGARVEWVCSNGTDAIQMVYTGHELRWEGSLECPLATVDGCMTTVRLNDARAFLTQSGAIVFEATGTSSAFRAGSACAQGPASLYFSFHATR